MHQVSPQLNFWFGRHTALKRAPLKQYLKKHDDVMKLILHRYVANMKEIMFKHFETIVINTDTNI